MSAEEMDYWNRFDIKEIDVEKNRDLALSFFASQMCPECNGILKETKAIKIPAFNKPDPLILAKQFTCVSCNKRIIVHRTNYDRPLGFRIFVIYKKDY